MENTNNSALYLHALTPVHSGTGQAAASDIDLPIAREKATNWPVIPASSLKGVLKDAAKALPAERIDQLFGWMKKDDEGVVKGAAGQLQIGDARLLCFPVRSWKGVFAYVTCPLALSRMHRDFTALGVPTPIVGQASLPVISDDHCLVVAGCVLVDQAQSSVWIEDLKLTAAEDAASAAVANGIAEAVFESGDRESLVSRFVIVSDDVFDFLAETATEVTARIALDEKTKTVKSGALWYEEAVPAEAIFVAPVLGAPVPVTDGAVLQIGGNETVGRGLCRVKVVSQ